jgi:hypothetical protein
MNKFIITFLFIFLLAGCSKPGEEHSSVNNKIYYDTYAAGIGPGAVSTDFESKRVCYDVGKDKVLWEKSNEHIMLPSHVYSVDDIEYSKAFIKGDYIIKIFPAKDDPGSFSYNASGIYFEKINKHTGQAAISSKIINSTEFNSGQSQQYIMSNVIADGDNFIFGCNNGYLYCYDLSGSLVWKKSKFPNRRQQSWFGESASFL